MRILWRSVRAAETIVPSLGKMSIGILRNLLLQRFGKGHAYTVLVRMEADGKLCIGAGVADALETTIVGRIGSPARHAGDIKLSINRIEPAAMNSRCKLTGNRNSRPLNPIVEFVTQQQKRSSTTER